jgi:hypothetical protein
MPANKTISLWLLSAVFLAGCVEPYTPEIKESDQSFVVEGILTDRPGFQYVYVSYTSSFNNPQSEPVAGCQLSVNDDRGNTYPYTDLDGGTYALWTNDGELSRDASYKLVIIPPGTDARYESEWETFGPPCAPIDSLYYVLETVETADPDQSITGLQFYIDVIAGDEHARNYRWELTETFEYHALNPIQYYWDGYQLYNISDPYIYYRCWKTDRVGGIFTASTQQSEETKILGYPLNYVSERTNHLMIGYSLLVRQYSLSDDAYEYWDRMREQITETGGLYEKQPVQLLGNLVNINDPSEVVLGYFNVCSATEQRIFIDGRRDMNFPGFTCELRSVRNVFHMPRDWPVPIYMKSLSPTGAGPPYGIGRGICFDCRTMGGTNIKPDYW